jgi:uncharacterized protein (TIGR03435 family)
MSAKPTAGTAPVVPPLGRCVIHAARLSHLIGIAYGVQMDQLKSGPDWIARGDERYDIEAKVDDPTKVTEKQLLEMLQNLLTERFELKFHLDPIEVPGFRLVVGKNGPKIQTTRSIDAIFDSNIKSAKRERGDPLTLRLRKCSMPRFAEMLTWAGNKGPIVDRTGLTGEYDLSIAWDEEAGPTLATALSEQLGLKLEPQKVTRSVFVIESAEKPSAN